MEQIVLLKEGCHELGLQIEEKQCQQFMVYSNLLLEWNEKMNLTAITERNEIVLKHFIDSISLLKGIEKKEKISLIDVGTGAGFPGIPVKIMKPDWNVTLLDSLQKRIVFLNEVVTKLGLEQVECIHARAEDGGKNPKWREQYDYCVSRAVANLTVLCEYCLPFVKIGGYFVSLKGPDIEEELKGAEIAIKKLGGCVENILTIQIPHTNIRHSLIMIKKICQTPAQFPRKAGKVSKVPIK